MKRSFIPDTTTPTLIHVMDEQNREIGTITRAQELFNAVGKYFTLTGLSCLQSAKECFTPPHERPTPQPINVKQEKLQL